MEIATSFYEHIELFLKSNLTAREYYSSQLKEGKNIPYEHVLNAYKIIMIKYSCEVKEVKSKYSKEYIETKNKF